MGWLCPDCKIDVKPVTKDPNKCACGGRDDWGYDDWGCCNCAKAKG
eukprot:CAMPEP_0206252392 /NCGR_PEP_ID=MMETSP0047_2-20121206/22553_1 /ASSEMBLY_ACC=CAM_ASM_000192 /TAXON_ID=195065 /ORGANISM="Chroomonas mesostigmatica_cf, Strain CCMP1168" /LENGTH=45 /DNA_ID= /DNA_START= /DNA_END= /DNA_ORIENTATION=